MLGRKHSLKGGEQIILADYGPDECLNTENQDLEWVNKVELLENWKFSRMEMMKSKKVEIFTFLE